MKPLLVLSKLKQFLSNLDNNNEKKEDLLWLIEPERYEYEKDEANTEAITADNIHEFSIEFIHKDSRSIFLKCAEPRAKNNDHKKNFT